MANINELIGQRESSKAEYAEQKKQERQDFSDMEERGMLAAAKDAARYLNYLDLQARNPHLSAGNVMLISEQNPLATDVRSYNDWKKVGRFVRKGPEALKVWQAERYTSRRTTEVRDYGSGAVHESVSQETRRGYKLDNVYDVTQTQGSPITDRPRLKEDTPEMQTALSVLIQQSPVPVVGVVDLPPEITAEYNPGTRSIEIQPELPDAECFQALATETAHAKLHGIVGDAYQRKYFDLDAQSIGYMVCVRYGLDNIVPPDTKTLKSQYKDMDPQQIRAYFKELRGQAKEIGDPVQQRVFPRGRSQEQQKQTRSPFASR